MSSIICECNRPCKFKGERFCGRDLLMITPAGACEVWYDKNGQPRQEPYYGEEAKQKDGYAPS